MSFNRTVAGLVAKHLFYREPLVWVEGPSDIPFYEEVLSNFQCRVEAAGGREECSKLTESLIKHDFPYVVILDGDYGILERKRSPHRRVILLQRYSTENYLFEKEPAERVCRNCARLPCGEDLIGDSFEEVITYLESELRELIILDIANYRASTGRQVLPHRADALLGHRERIIFDSARLAHLVATAASNLHTSEIEEARRLIDVFLSERRLIDIVRGHFLFGVLRRLIWGAVRRRSGRKPTIDDNTLKILLTVAVWRGKLETDHKNLRRRLLRAVREVRKRLVAA